MYCGCQSFETVRGGFLTPPGDTIKWHVVSRIHFQRWRFWIWWHSFWVDPCWWTSRDRIRCRLPGGLCGNLILCVFCIALKNNQQLKPFSSIAEVNGWFPIRRQAITWTNAELLSLGPHGTSFSDIWTEVRYSSFQKMLLKISSAWWQPFCFQVCKHYINNTFYERTTS